MKLVSRKKLSSLFWMPVMQVILLICLSIVLVLFGIYKDTSLWFDEIWLAGVISDSSCFKDFLVKIIQDHQQPLLFVIEYFIYGIADGNEVIFRLPSILSVTAGTVVLLNLGHKHPHLGILPALLAITSNTLLCLGAYNARPYGMLFFFSSLTFYLFASERKGTYFWAYSISILLLSMTHWFGLLLAFCFMAVDIVVVLFRARKTDGERRMLWSYLFCLPALIWTYLVVKFLGNSLLHFWGDVPDFNMLKGLVRYLCSYVRLYKWAFYIGCIAALLRFFLKKEKDGIYIISFVLILLMIVPVFIYSRYINPDGCLFHIEYFISIIPFVFVLVSYTLSLPIIYISKNADYFNLTVLKIGSYILRVFVLLVIAKYGVSNWKSCYHRPLFAGPYSQVADFVHTNLGSDYSNSLIIIGKDDPSGGYISKGFTDFYFHHQRRQLPDNVGYMSGNNNVTFIRHNGISCDESMDIDRISADAIIVVQGELPSALEGSYRAGTQCAGGTIYYLK